MKRFLILVILLISQVFVFAQEANSLTNDGDNENSFRAVAELGFLNVLDHKIQFSNNGTYFDYRREGGQDVLFPISRLSLEYDFKKRNTFVFLYQPLRIESTVLLENGLVVDDLIYPAGTGVKLLYNFPFYRFSYLRKLKIKNDKYDLAIGGSLQLRNATISFESLDGARFRTNRDVGPVPAFKIKSKAQLNTKFFLEFEADGIYAPVSYLNGSDNEVIGAILDASLRTGLSLKEPIVVFFNLRYLGGGAVGTSDDSPSIPGDGYVRNWLHFSTVSLGFIYDWEY